MAKSVLDQVIEKNKIKDEDHFIEFVTDHLYQESHSDLVEMAWEYMQENEEFMHEMARTYKDFFEDDEEETNEKEEELLKIEEEKLERAELARLKAKYE